MTTWVKLCGCTSAQDVDYAIAAGADAFGMIFAPSPRRIAWNDAVTIARTLPSSIVPVAVFANAEPAQVDAVRELFPQAWLQFSGDESPEQLEAYGERMIKTLHVDAASSSSEIETRCERFARATLLFDTKRDGVFGGTGSAFAWEKVRNVASHRRVVVAGGLRPENVGSCVQAVRPFGVDVRSGIETDGCKDAAKMRAFVRAVREADAA